MKRLFSSFIALLTLTLLFSPLASLTQAADIVGEDQITISGENRTLDNPYLFGEQINVSVPVQNDLVTGGGNITLESPVTGSIWAAGGNVDITSQVGNSVRVAGGDITISGPIRGDLIVIGGTVRVTKEASIGGDLIFTGGQLQLDGPVGGFVLAQGGSVTLNSQIGKEVKGEMGELTLGPNAQIGGDLIYSAANPGTIDENKVAGRVTYSPSERTEEAQSTFAKIFTAGTLYKLVADILFVLLLIWLLRPLLERVIQTIDNSYLKHGGLGFATLILTPLAGLFLLIILWLGISVFLLYFLLLILASALTKLFVGWKALSWWERRNNREYDLDWKAALVGVLLIFIVGLIPVLGWLVVFLLFLVTLGGLTAQFFRLIESQRELPAETRPTPTSTKKKR